MARPKSSDKRQSILEAATRVIVSRGLSGPTALIAREAGVSNGSLFTYFETKNDLFNQLYLDLKGDMTSAISGFDSNLDLRSQVYHVWVHWTGWAVSHPEKRRALKILATSDLVLPASRQAGHQMMGRVLQLVEQVRQSGTMRDAPMPFVGAVVDSIAETTIDFMIQDPGRADEHLNVGFEACWRAVG